MAVDVGFAVSGVAVFERVMETDANHWYRLRDLRCIRTLKDAAKRHRLRADEDVDRVGQMARGLLDLILHYEVKRAVVELPNAGAINYNACRAMSLASGMIVAVMEASGIAVEYYTPRQTRYAACQKYDPSKKEIVAAMLAKYPELGQVALAIDRENCADALATFEAARAGNLTRL